MFQKFLFLEELHVNSAQVHCFKSSSSFHAVSMLSASIFKCVDNSGSLEDFGVNVYCKLQVNQRSLPWFWLSAKGFNVPPTSIVFHLYHLFPFLLTSQQNNSWRDQISSKAKILKRFKTDFSTIDCIHRVIEILETTILKLVAINKRGFVNALRVSSKSEM